MISETKQKNWFSRHWIVSTILVIIILGTIITGISDTNQDNSNTTGNVVNEQSQQEETTKCADSFFEQTCINKKINECTKLCAGEDINIPSVKAECYSSCYQVYYYGGEKELDEYIKEWNS